MDHFIYCPGTEVDILGAPGCTLCGILPETHVEWDTSSSSSLELSY